jgi:hypothetical protein
VPKRFHTYLNTCRVEKLSTYISYSFCLSVACSVLSLEETSAASGQVFYILVKMELNTYKCKKIKMQCCDQNESEIYVDSEKAVWAQISNISRQNALVKKFICTIGIRTRFVRSWESCTYVDFCTYAWSAPRVNTILESFASACKIEFQCLEHFEKYFWSEQVQLDILTAAM